MMRWHVLYAGLVFSLLACAAQADDPQVTITSEQDEVIVGQPYVIKVEVLVPTFMPKAPVFPSFEVPGVIVRLPERSTSPISERIDGETWSGVRRTYRIYPMTAGEIAIPDQQLSIVYKDTETNEDVPLSVDVPPTQFTATIPEGAETVDPLIVAKDVSIEQSWDVAEGELAVGDAVVRTLKISVDGTSALFVPPLLETALPDGAPNTVEGDAEDAPQSTAFLPYPEDPIVTEKMDRGVMSGTRTETVSYIAQDGGTFQFPSITLRWYNLETEQVEDISLEGREISVALPPVVREPLDRGVIARIALLVALAVGFGLAVHRWVWPYVLGWLHNWRAAYHRSLAYAHSIAVKRAAARDLDGLLKALELRKARGHPDREALSDAVMRLTRAIYRDGQTAEQAATEWQAVQHALQKDRPGALVHSDGRRTSSLVPLNPF